MKFELSNYTKNNYKTPQKPGIDLLMGLGWKWYLASVTAHQYSQFEIEGAIKAAKEQSAKQGKDLVKSSYILAILRNKK